MSPDLHGLAISQIRGCPRYTIYELRYPAFTDMRYTNDDVRLLRKYYLQLCQIYNVLIKKHFLVFVRNR